MTGIHRALVLVVGLTVVACAAQHQLSYEEIVTQAVQLFNQRQRGKPLFRLLEAIPPHSLNSTSRIPLNFRIKETVCRSIWQRQRQDCAFREGGEERKCTGNFLMVRKIRILVAKCSKDPPRDQQAPREKRSAESSLEANINKLPPAARELYEKAKYDIIANILRNF
ncbi:15 kDa protein B-like [Orycteropus afer afer]|uniref:15 kDa protein B-like n=1 Tax=Orycteropus afer afer TaxID=1230840 RepID=A0A8B7AR28_ORYAF|nr:15 kDa protein B-like [Orycteropus afer afer]